jgi:opacity protein-like surface antigen
MKKTSNILIVMSVCAGAAFWAPLRAHSQQGHFYLKGDLGGNWTLDTELKEYLDEPVRPGSKVRFHPGVRFGVGGGYYVTDWFSTEFETGVMANDINTITDATRVDATFSNVPFLVNARFQCPRFDLLNPYFGGGVGGAVSVLDVDRIDRAGFRDSGTVSDGVFAYQAFAGLRYRINDNMGVSLEYHYFATSSPSLEPDFAPGRILLGGASTHSVSVSFDFRF